MIIGISDYVRPPYDVEAKALGEGVGFIDFSSGIEDDINVERLKGLDALDVIPARRATPRRDRHSARAPRFAPERTVFPGMSLAPYASALRLRRPDKTAPITAPIR